jgi:D-alanine-D-alanine ligase-like ATP-grasp enzyme
MLIETETLARSGVEPTGPRVLVVNRQERDPDKRASEDRRFSSLAAALSSGGLAVERATPSGMGELREAMREFSPHLVFASFFRFPEQAEGEGYLEGAAIDRGAAWIGSPSGIMELALSKPRLKSLWRSYGIPTPDWLIVRSLPEGSVEGLEELASLRDFPYIVKPAREGNSRGIDDRSVARAPDQLRARAEEVVRDYCEALVERFVSGGRDSREFTVAMIGNGKNSIVSPIEIVKTRPSSSVITEDDKERQTTRLLPVGDDALRGKIECVARRVFLASGARDYARCDILLHEGRLYAIEMNGQPMVPDRWFEACSREAGLDGVQYINAIALAGMADGARTGRARLSIPPKMRKMLPEAIVERLAS